MQIAATEMYFKIIPFNKDPPFNETKIQIKSDALSLWFSIETEIPCNSQ